MITWNKKGEDIFFYRDDFQIAVLKGSKGAVDTLTPQEEGVFLWNRICEPVSYMIFQLETTFSAEYFMVPGLNYNGNGFGTFCEYTKDRYQNEPWIYGWHRATVPAMSMSQGSYKNHSISVSLFGEANDESCFSVYKEHDKTIHRIMWPEKETPKQLNSYRYGEAFYTEMEPRREFSAWIVIQENAEAKMGYTNAIDKAFIQNYKQKAAEWQSSEIWNMGISFAKLLYTEERDGFCGFNIGLALENNEWKKRTRNKYEIGWCGQNALLANALLHQSLRDIKDQESKKIGFKVLDSWIKYAYLPIGVLHSYYDPGQDRYLEACNLGTAGLTYFEAYDLSIALGETKANYFNTAIDICKFALKTQGRDGQFAKCWKENGNVAIEEGTVGVFLAMPLAEAWRRTGEIQYKEAAEKSLRYYMKELRSQGFTTAGALDIFSIDKESSIPLLKCAMMLYKMTGEKEWLEDAECAAYYLSTWQFAATEYFTGETTLGQTGYDSYGGTLVSTVHEGMDSFALSYVPELYWLWKETGKQIWYLRAKAVWKNGCQHLSDGTRVINGVKRPKGSQDESFELSRQARWGSSSCWLVAWPGAFRMDTLVKLDGIEEFQDFFE